MNNILIIPFILFGVLNAQSSTINVQQKIPKAKIIDNLEKSGKGKSIDKLQKKYLSNDNNENIDESSSEINPSNLDVIEIDGIKYIKDGLRYIPVINDKIVLEKLSNDEEAINLKSIETNITDDLDFYGYNIFTGDPNSFQSSTFGAVDPNYNIGPGDQIIVMLWGESQFRQEFTIDREGYVFLPEVGQVFVNGLNLMALEKKFFQLLSKVYSTLKPLNGKPTTFMDISLGNLRPLRIIVLGEVNQPGAYSVNPSTSLSSSLYYFNGPTTSGSLRNIRLIRGGKFLGSIDFYDYLLSGNTPDDQRLQLDDVVFIPLRGKTVKIFGEITRQGIYELKENEGLENLIQIAGNMKATAYLKRAQIKRIIPPEKRSQMGMDRKIIDINLDNKFHDYKFIYLEDGDEIEIFSIEDVNKNFVEIIGSSVTRPGKYQLLPGMRVMDLLDNADGLLNNAYMNRSHLLRLQDDLSYKIISINLEELFNGVEKQNILLNYMDKLTIYNNNKLSNINSDIYISGPIKNPGYYPLSYNETLGDLIIKSGGLKIGLNKIKISIARVNPVSYKPEIFYFPSKKDGNSFISISNLEDKSMEMNNFQLKAHDIINIYPDPRDRLPGIVSIAGAVYFPGDYPISSNNEKVTDIITRAGGLMPEAYPMASSFIRGNKTIQLSFAEMLKNPSANNNFSVIHGDSILIRTKPNSIEIIGEVNNPGIFKYYKNLNMMNYINIAGGLTVNAEKKEIWVSYPDGTSKQLKNLLPSPRMYDGSSITVGKQVESDPIDKTELAKEIASIISDFLNIYISLTILARTADSL